MSTSKPTIAIVGPGAWATSLSAGLHAANYRIVVIAARRSSHPQARALARRVAARVQLLDRKPLEIGDAGIIWFCVPDDVIASVAAALAAKAPPGFWKGRTVLHSSGALPSSALDVLRRQGAWAASLHPMMTFPRGAVRSLRGVPFAVEGDAAAVRRARTIARDLGGTVFPIRPQEKVLYHMWGFFASPLLLTLLATAEQIAVASGIPSSRARTVLAPIVRQTVENFLTRGAHASLTGPLARGDLVTIRKHLVALRRVPQARELYRALALTALRLLPVRRRRELQRLLAKT